MLTVSISIAGLDAFRSALERFGSDGARELDNAVYMAAQRLRDLSVQMPPVSAPRDGWDAVGFPVDTGLTRQETQARKLQSLAAEVFSGTDYSGYIQEGTTRTPPRDYFRWALEDFGGLQVIEDVVNDTLQRLFQV